MSKVIQIPDWSWKPDKQEQYQLSQKQKKRKQQLRQLKYRNYLCKRVRALSGINADGRNMVCITCRCLKRPYPLKKDYVGEIDILEEYIIARGGKINRKTNEFYKSDAWRRLRYKIIKKYGSKCMVCGATDKPIHVDHIKPRSKYPELELDEDNQQVFCDDCNLGKSNLDEIDWRPK